MSMNRPADVIRRIPWPAIFVRKPPGSIYVVAWDRRDREEFWTPRRTLPMAGLRRLNMGRSYLRRRRMAYVMGLVLFVCVENTFRSVLSEALFNAIAPRGWRAE